VQKVERIGDVFEVTGTNGKAHGRRVVLAYGVRDILPDIPGVEKYYGGSIHHCPDCDGYKVRDSVSASSDWGKRAVGLALKMPAAVL
jgi:thioredoxin reductase